MKFVLISVILLASFVAALSLKCYTCTDCGSSDGDATTCSSGNNKCMKAWGKDKSGKEEIDRACGTQSNCDLAVAACKVAKEQDLGDCAVGCCDSDLCNSGTVPSFSVLLVSLCSLFAVIPFIK